MIYNFVFTGDLEDLRKISTNASSMFHEKQRQQKVCTSVLYENAWDYTWLLNL